MFVQSTKASKDKATKIHRKGRVNFCLTCLIMLIVGLLFAGKSAGAGHWQCHW
jgi:hypothetical protein